MLTVQMVPKHFPFNLEVEVKFYFQRNENLIKVLALICFGSNSKSCEIFDGSTAVTTFATSYTHGVGGLGFYKNQPSSMGCWWQNHKKAESLTSTGWSALPDHPE